MKKITFLSMQKQTEEADEITLIFYNNNNEA